MSKNRKKEHKFRWTPIIIVVLILTFLLIVSFSGNKTSLGDSNKINLAGSSQIKTINNPSQIISIDLVGSSNVISITKETSVSKINIAGSSNTFNLCKNHSPKIDETGNNNVFNYLNC